MTHRQQRSFGNRRSLRLRGYEYAQAGAYFITICTRDRAPLLGHIADCKTILNGYGEVVAECWHELPDHFPTFELDAFIVMPNHVHGSIVLTGDNTITHNTRRGEAELRPSPPAPTATPHGRQPRGTQRNSVGALVQAFSSFSTRAANQLAPVEGGSLWQRNYHDHIIRNEDELRLLREYIETNPLPWELDSLYSAKESSRG